MEMPKKADQQQQQWWQRPNQIDDIKGKQIKSWSGSTVSEMKSLGEAIKLVTFFFVSRKNVRGKDTDYPKPNKKKTNIYTSFWMESVFYSKIRWLYRTKQNNLKVIKKYLNLFEIHNSIYFIVTVD